MAKVIFSQKFTAKIFIAIKKYQLQKLEKLQQNVSKKNRNEEIIMLKEKSNKTLKG